MRKYFSLFLILFTGIIALSQTDVDAMRYSQSASYGDTRFMSMGGAFGSLGANTSCMEYNPAGIAMYRKGEIVFTPGFQIQSAAANHYGSSTSDFSAKLSVSNFGFVAAWSPKNGGNSGGRRQSGNPYKQYNQQNSNQPAQPSTQRDAIGFSYNRVADFNYHSTIQGNAPNSSIMNSFRDVANTQGGQLDSFYTNLAYQTYLINPYNPNQNTPPYFTFTDFNNNQQTLVQKKTTQSSGRIGELLFAYAHSFNDQLYVGASLGIPLLKYKYQSSYTEEDTKDQVPYFKSLQYQEAVSTSGFGINLKGGAIYRAKNGMRFGLYGQTATFYRLSDNYQNSLTVTYDSTFIPDGYGGYVNNAAYDSPAGYYNYGLRTPGKVGASVSYIYNKILAFSGDVEHVNYAKARFNDTQGSFTDVNDTIQKKYGGTFNFKVGAELNIRPVVLRLGLASYGSPFGQVLSSDFVRNSLSGGVGFRGGKSVYLDVGFVYTSWKEKYYVIDPMYVNPTNISNSTIYLTATLGIKFN